RRDLAVRPNVLANVIDGVFGNVRAPRLDASLPQRSYEHARTATGVEHCLRPDLGDDRIGDAAEESLPVRVVGPIRLPEGIRLVVETVVVLLELIGLVARSSCHRSAHRYVFWEQGREAASVEAS